MEGNIIIEDYIEKIAFYKDLSDSEKQLVRDNSVIREFEKGSVIHSCSGACLGMIYVISGSIRVSIISEEGREITLYRLKEGDTCVISAACVLHQIRLEHGMVAATDVRLLVLNSKTLAGLVNNNIHVRCYSYELATARFSDALFVLQEIIFERFDKRLAVFLIDLCEKEGTKELVITQEQIASEVNSAREVVARMLKQFSVDELVELKRGKIIIRDIEGLRSLT